MSIAQSWNNVLQTFIGIALAFFFGYLLTSAGAYREGISLKDSLKLALAVDTISIISMVIIDNTIEWLIPGAINAYLSNAIFWWSEAISLTSAFILTVPVNRFVMARSARLHSHK